MSLTLNRNGYQSIHSVVLGPGGKTLEVQIRTNQMHENAELGIAAHWKYKEGTTAGRAGYDSRIAWLRKLISWQGRDGRFWRHTG